MSCIQSMIKICHPCLQNPATSHDHHLDNSSPSHHNLPLNYPQILLTDHPHSIPDLLRAFFKQGLLKLKSSPNSPGSSCIFRASQRVWNGLSELQDLVPRSLSDSPLTLLQHSFFSCLVFLLAVQQACQADSCLQIFLFAVPITRNTLLPHICLAHSSCPSDLY
jgi:hypothetical protein